MNQTQTLCRDCGKELDDKDKKRGDSIMHCGKFQVVGNRNVIGKEKLIRNKKIKREVKMVEKVKRGQQKKIILDLLTSGKTVDEIIQETGFRKAHVNNIKKAFSNN